MDLLQKNKLLFSRAGFGIKIEDYLNPMPIDQIVNELFPSAHPTEMQVVTKQDWEKYSPAALKAMASDEDRQAAKKEFRQKIKDLNLVWLDQMVYTSFPLLEKTALFWHGHFATKIGNPYYDQQLLNIFRLHAFGNFGDMLREVSKSPAMLQFLNNQQNKKQHPNENFAREVMELFTLGRGNYTENDIKEAARAFTGWAHDENGEFIVRKRQHDDGEKTFLGKKGYFNGDDIIDIILKQEQTAYFITRKLYAYFVSDEKADEKRIKQLAGEFYENKYDIGALLKTMFTADWFYKESTVGAKIKSPVELLVGYQRLMHIQFPEPKTLLNIQRVLGQVLFEPPNVAGWPGGKSWIDSSSLVVRMRLSEALLATKDLDLSPKENDPEMGAMYKAQGAMEGGGYKPYRNGKAIPDWDPFIEKWSKVPKSELAQKLADFLLTVPVSEQHIKEIEAFADHFETSDYIKSLTILLMGLPEFQLS